MSNIMVKVERFYSPYLGGGGWSGTESTITETTTDLLYQPWMMMDGDGCGIVGGMIGRETEVLGENLPQCSFEHCKSHMTLLGLEPEPQQWEASE
jgi:hypothetical protein